MTSEHVPLYLIVTLYLSLKYITLQITIFNITSLLDNLYRLDSYSVKTRRYYMARNFVVMLTHAASMSIFSCKVRLLCYIKVAKEARQTRFSRTLPNIAGSLQKNVHASLENSSKLPILFLLRMHYSHIDIFHFLTFLDLKDKIQNHNLYISIILSVYMLIRFSHSDILALKSGTVSIWRRSHVF